MPCIFLLLQSSAPRCASVRRDACLEPKGVYGHPLGRTRTLKYKRCRPLGTRGEAKGGPNEATHERAEASERGRRQLCIGRRTLPSGAVDSYCMAVEAGPRRPSRPPRRLTSRRRAPDVGGHSRAIRSRTPPSADRSERPELKSECWPRAVPQSLTCTALLFDGLCAVLGHRLAV